MSTDINVSFGRVVYYEPNEIFGGDNKPVNQEDLNKYINLSVRIPSRYYNTNSFKSYDSILNGTRLTEKKDGEEYTVFYLTDNYVNVSYNEIRANGRFSAGELFGIDSIDISFDVQFFPQVTINFTDVKGFGLMSTMEYNYEEGKINNLTAKSFFTSLFNFPYPIFTLEVKGYYGKSVSFDLSLLEFNTAFDSQTGNFKTTVKFIGHMYGVYADIPMSFLMVSPYIEVDQTPNKEILGYTWNNISNKNDIKEIPTYLSVLRNFSDFILHVNFNNEGYSIYQDFIKEEAKIDNLNSIIDILNIIIDVCNETKSLCPPSLIYGNNDIIYVAKKNDNGTEPALDQVLTPHYGNLLTLTSSEQYITYRPNIEKRVAENKIIWYFPDIIQRRDNYVRERQLIEQSQNLEKENLNTALLEDITNKLHIIPNIKNIYKILFKHLHCFSEHFFNIIENIDENRKISGLGLTNFETDIPMNSNSDNQIVPPFPAIYQTNNNERQIIYPGDITGFKSEPEVLFTEKLFKSITYFGKESIQSLNQIETARNIINEVTSTESGSFFADGRDVINNLLKHYAIINVANSLFSQRTFNDEQSYRTEITRSTTIRDIFLSRLATFGRIHYTPEREDFFVNTEASLLFNSWKTMNVFDEKILSNLRNMKEESVFKDTILDRYKTLSGGTHDNEFWGYINYQPGDENNDLDIEQLAREGRIHYNGFSGSTIIVYAKDVSRDAGANILANIKFGADDDFKVECDAYYEYSYGDSAVVYSYYQSGSSYKFDECPSYLYVNNEDNIILNKTFYNKDGDFYNWGYKKHCPLGGSDTWTFLFDRYCTLGSTTTTGGIDDETDFFTHLDDPESPDSQETEKANHVPGCNTLNRIALINECAFHSIREYYEAPDDTIFGSKDQLHGDGYNTIDYYYAGRLAIPTNKLSDSTTMAFVNRSISRLEMHDLFYDFIKDIPNYNDRNLHNYRSRYYVIGKNFQYEREGVNILTDSKIWQIWVNFVNKVLTNYGLEENITSESHAREIDQRESDKKIKTDIYYTLKTLYDKWYCGLNREYFNINNGEKGEFHKIHYLTTTFNDISNSMIVDLETFVNQIGNAALSTDQSSLSVLSFMAKTAQDNNSSFLTLPMKLNWGITQAEVEEIFKPHSFYDGTATHDSHGVSYVVMYNGDVSHQLADNNNEYTNDGYDIANYFGSSIAPSLEATRLFAKKINEEHDYNVPAFGVTYGMQNQNFFKNISVDTTNPSVSDYSIANTLIISQRGSLAGTNNSVPSVKSIYPIYANRSYTCNVEMMGCMNITPLMYFQLNNVPLFRGAYIITNVHHRITPIDFTTTFSGVRVSKYKIPINKDAIGITSLLRTIGLTDGDRRGGTFSYDSSNDAECQIVVNREVFYSTGTVGRLYINGVFQCFTMEPTVRLRGSEGNIPSDACNHVGDTNAICPGTYVIKYDHSWAGTATDDPKYQVYYAAGHARDGKIYTPRLNPYYEEGGTPGRSGILIHMGNSNYGVSVTEAPAEGYSRWSKGCIIVGYPANNDPSEDLTNSGNTTLESLRSFGTGYGNHVNNITEWSTARAFMRVAKEVKDHTNNAKITIAQNLSDDEIISISRLTGTNHLFKPLAPPVYTNAGIPEGCLEIYNTMTNYGSWDNLMENKGMTLITRNNNLVIDLKYATHDNFAHRPMYIGLNNAYIHSGHMGKITTITNILSTGCTNHTGATKLIIYDAARPAIVQKYMTCLKNNTSEVYPAIASPGGSFHNYGLALDISLMGPDGKPLFMGAGFDQPLGNMNTSGYTSGHLGYEEDINLITVDSIGDITFAYAEEDSGIVYNNVTYSKYYVSSITSNSEFEFVESEADYVNSALTNGGLELDNEIIEMILNNRLLLILLTRKAGMTCYEDEWWHYYFGTKNNNNLIHDPVLGSL